MLPDGPSSSENKMTLPTDVHLHLPVITPSNYENSIQIQIDKIYPGIYLTNEENFWTNDKLRSHGFTHIILIDKHIQNHSTTDNDFKILFSQNLKNNNNNNDSVINENKLLYSSYSAALSNFQNQVKTTAFKNVNNEFEILDLNFGEESFLTTVLPNCYKAVKFIDKALQYGGAIIIIDRYSNQKCLTIVTAYLMYKFNLKFSDAFQKIKNVYESAELDKYFISQLYEYEPILQVQRAQLKGHSCSRELRMAFLKRKKIHDNSCGDNNYNSSFYTTASGINNFNDNSDICME